MPQMKCSVVFLFPPSKLTRGPELPTLMAFEPHKDFLLVWLCPVFDLSFPATIM